MEPPPEGHPEPKTCNLYDSEADRRRISRRERCRLKKGVSRMLPQNRRLARCGRPLSRARGVQIRRCYRETPSGQVTHSDFYCGLMTCGLVWLCPVCAVVITEHRRRELVAAMEKWVGAGNSVFLLTQTIRHHKGQRLAGLLENTCPAIYFLKRRGG